MNGLFSDQNLDLAIIPDIFTFWIVYDIVTEPIISSLIIDSFRFGQNLNYQT
jgi:hypothetical protein